MMSSNKFFRLALDQKGLLALLMILSLSFIAQDALAQYANVTYSTRSSFVTSYDNPILGDCYELDDKEYTSYMFSWDNINGTSSSTGCEICTDAGNCTYNEDVDITTRTNQASQLSFSLDAWEDDTGDRCSFDVCPFPDCLIPLEDDCRRTETQTVDTFRSVAAPSNGSYTVTPTWGSSDNHRWRGQYTWKYGGSSNSITPGCSVQTAAYSAGDIRSWSVNLTAGETYEFDLCGEGGDTYLRLYGSDGYTVVTFNDDFCGPYGASRITYAAASSGWHYLEISEFDRAAVSTSGVLSYRLVDTTDPVATCPTNIVTANDANLCSAVVSYMVSSSDNCGVVSFTQTAGLASGVAFPVGTTTNTFEATDAEGNTGSCSFTVRVNDTQDPVASCPGNVVAGNDVTFCGRTVLFPDAMVTDNCPVSIAQTAGLGSGSLFPVGLNTITYTATDASMNTHMCSFTITISDVEPPLAVCANITAQLSAAGTVTVTGSMVDGGSSDNCAVTSRSVAPAAFGCANVGGNPYTLTVQDAAGNPGSCNGTITVQDTIPPVAVCNAFTVQLNAAGNGSVTGADIGSGSTDACGIASLSAAPSAFTCANVGGNTVVLTVTDNNTNIATCSATVTVEDNVDPTPLCVNVNVELDAAGNGSITAGDIDGGSSDACGVASLSVSPNTFDCSNVGPVTVTLTVTDVNSNAAVCTATATVADNVNPVAVCKDITVDLNASGAAIITGADIDDGSSDACGILSLFANPGNFDCSHVGSNTVALLAFDVNGNSGACVSNVEIEDNVAPNAVCTDITVELDAGGAASITTGDIDGGSSDACGIAGMSVDPSDFTCDSTGANTVTLTVSDVNGNDGTCTATVTVEDNILPTITCPGDITASADPGVCTAAVSVPQPIVFDNCGEGGSLDSTSSPGTATIDNDTICDVITVSGTGGTVVGITVDVDLSHFWVGDVGITLTSPDGTDIVLLDRPGWAGSGFGCNDDDVVMTFDDASATDAATLEGFCNGVGGAWFAGPDGQPVTALAALAGENVDGDWTLCVSDGVSGDGGALNSWSVNIIYADPPGGGTEPGMSSPGSLITNINPTTCDVIMLASGTGLPVSDVTVLVDIEHTFVGDLQITLTSPDGSTLSLMDRPGTPPGTLGCYGDDILVTFDDSSLNDSLALEAACSSLPAISGDYQPRDFFSTLDGETVDGDWTLCVTDNAAGDEGFLNSWTINVEYGGGARISGTNDLKDLHAGMDLRRNASADRADKEQRAELASRGQSIVKMTSNNSAQRGRTISGVESQSAEAKLIANTISSANLRGTLALENDYNNTDDASDTYPLGSTLVTWTATDESGNSASCSHTVIVTDDEAPTASCQDITVYLDAAGTASITEADVDGGSSDICSPVTLSASPTTFECGNAGANSVTLTVTDTSGNSASCTATVMVMDTIPPTITCANDTSVTAELDSCNAFVNVNGPTVMDNCENFCLSPITDAGSTVGGPIWDRLDETGSFISGSGAGVNYDAFTFIAPETGSYDISSLQDYDGFIHLYENSFNPLDQFTNFVAGNDDGFGGLGTSDISGVTLTSGTTYILVTSAFFTGDAGNFSTTISIPCNMRTMAPVAIVQLYEGFNGLNNIEEAKAAWLNENKVTFSPIPNGGTHRAILSLTNDYNGTADASDTYPVGSTVITWTATDSLGNSSTCTQTVTVTDDQAPDAICQDLTVTLDGSGAASVTPAEVDDGSSDNCGIASLSLDDTDFDCSDVVADTTGLVLRGADNLGNYYDINLATGGATIVGSLNGACGGPIGVNAMAYDPISDRAFAQSPNGCFEFLEFDPATGDTIATYSSPGVPASLEFVGNTLYASDIIIGGLVTVDVNSGNAIPVGPHGGVLWMNGMAYDQSTGIMYGVPGGGPGANDLFTINLATGLATLVGNTGVNLGSINFGPDGKLYGGGGQAPDRGNIFEINTATGVATLIGPTGIPGPVVVNAMMLYESEVTLPMVTLTVTDFSGNSSTCTANVTVIDDEAPVFSGCPANISQSNDGGVCGALVTWTPPTAADNCLGDVVVTVSNPPGTFFPVGTTTVTYIATDVAGNTDSCEFDVTVTDDEDPFLTGCPADTIISADSGMCEAALVLWAPPVPSDNCPGVTMTSSNNSGETFPVGVTTVTYIATDVAGNDDTCTFTITIEDNENPIPACQSGFVDLDAAGTGSITAADIDDGSTDNCGIDTMTLDQYDFTCADVGSVTVTLTVTDLTGNDSTCTATVTVEDNVDPVAACQDITVYLDATGNVTISGSDIDGGSSDACGIASYDADPDAFTCDETGSNTVTLTVTDNNSNTATCTANVEVLDTIPPVITCPADVTASNDSGVCEGTVTVPQPSVLDNCDSRGTTLWNDYTMTDDASGVYPVGTTTVQWVAFDESGNSDTCYMDVTVEDDEDPVAVCQDLTIYLDASGNTFITAGDVDDGSDDNCAVVGLSIDQFLFNCALTGDNIVTLTATDAAGNEGTCTSTVEVLDTISPTITCAPAQTQTNDAGDCGAVVTVVPPTVADNCDTNSVSQWIINPVSIPDSIDGAIPDNDPAGFCDVISTGGLLPGATVTYVDQLIVVNHTWVGDLNITLTAPDGTVLTLLDQPGVPASTFGCADDNLIIFFADGSSTTAAELEDTCTGSDPWFNADAQPVTPYSTLSGLPAEGDWTLCVTDNGGGDVGYLFAWDIWLEWEAPNGRSGDMRLTSKNKFERNDASTALKRSTVDLTPYASKTLEDKLLANSPSANLRGPVGLTNDYNGSADASGFYPVGTTTVTWTATDASGNTDTCTQDITVTDDEAPVANCQDLTVELDVDGNGSITAAEVDSFSTDNCSIDTLEIDISEFTCSDVGSGNTVTLTVTDSSGNSSTCTSTITVEDNVAPDAVCQDITVYLDASGNVSITGADIDGGSTDACGVASLDADPSAFTCDELGSNTSTLTVTDVNSNTATCTANVEVLDTIAPAITCPGDIIVSNDTGVCEADVTVPQPRVNDNCGTGITLWNDHNMTDDASDTYPVGTTTIMWVASDVSGNSDTCYMDVTVNDDEDPNAVCEDITVQLDADGDASIVADDVDGGSTDNCDIDSLSIDVSTFDCSNVGGNSVELTVTDIYGNTGTCTATVTVADTIPPEALCQTVTTYLDENGEATIVAGDVDAGSNDACGIASLSVDPSMFSCDDINGATTTLTVTDVNDNSATCEADVIVLDTIPPVITCAADTIVENDPGVCGAFVMVEQPTADDNCAAGITLWNDFNMTDDASDDYSVGTTTVMWVAFDESGNSDTCYQDITVIDTEAPDPGCPADIDIFANVYECSAIVEWELDTTDNCPGPLSLDSNYEPGDTFPLGTTTVVYNVTDVAGNSASCSFDITVTSDLTITIDSVVDVSCFGGSDGAIFATISGGVEPYTIRWSNDQHIEDIDGLEPGSYVMYVEDAIGCSAISELVEVGEPTPIIEAAPAVITDSDCNGEPGGSIDVSISGGTPPYSYDWSNGSMDEDPSGLTAGTYQFTATDANGCTFLSPIYLIQEPTAISISSVITTDADCNGAATGAIDIEVSGGTPLYSFLWSNGLMDEDPSGLVAGDYSVTITDGNGCEIISEDITVGEPAEIVITALTATDAECNGDASGSINISVAGGTPPYTYFWSNGDDTQDIDGLAAGDYTGTITDANGCSLVSPTITIGEPDEISVSSLVIEDADCNGSSTGSIDIEVAGGTAPYTYSWSNGATTQDLTDVPSGTYTGTITDANGCALISPPLFIGEPTAIEITSILVTDNLCNGVEEGAIDIEVSGGTPLYTYSWSNGDITQDISGLAAGDYVVTITDGGGCELVSGSVTVGETDAIEEVDAVVSDVSCNEELDGAIDITLDGGTEPYEVIWSTGDTVEDLSGVAAGDYSYVVTDVNGCTFASSTISVGEPDGLDIELLVKDAVCSGGNSGNVVSTVSGGTEPYTYLWSNSANTPSLIGVAAGSYSVVVTDANGCSTTSDEVTVNEPATPLSATIEVVNESGYGSQDGSVTVTASGGDGPYEYAWNTGDDTESVSNLSAGTFCVTVTDANGCEIQECAEIGIGTAVMDLFEITDLTLYPNPTMDYTNLDMSFSRPVDIRVDLVNAIGQLIRSEAQLSVVEHQMQFDMSDQAAGTYFIRLTVEGELHTLPFIVQH
ncbi:MAG: HYR domain-containing protein [Bacteroidetes bacterium]|nr:HYR domain-containing protein [Bacteroidota bacterium]